MTTDSFRTARAGPVGLGGWLWPVTGLAATLPLFLTAAMVAALAGDLVAILRYGEIPDLLGESWVQREIGVMALLTTIAWWWAIRWFARDPSMLRRGPIALLACAAVVATIAGFERDSSEYLVIASILFCLATASFLGARWSTRVRNTFVAHPLPAPAHGWRGVLFGGPRDWSHRRWLLPGVLIYAAVRLFFELSIFSGAAFEAIPPAPPTTDPRIANGTAAALIAMGHPGRYIEASRLALALSSISYLLLVGALIGLVRGARWTPWLTLGALMLAMAAPVRMSFRDWCCPFLDGPEFERMWREWCVVILIAVLGGAFRPWPGTDQRAVP
jgi:hypothetical protein